MANSAALIPITHKFVRIPKAGGRASTPARASSPSVATVAYRLSPAAKLVATTSRHDLIAGKLHHPDRIVRRTNINPAK